jgi:arylsulfatase A-like enzyme
VIFTDHYAQQSCTAGRASFIMGPHPYRTGMLTIGMPGSKQGIQPGDITIAEALKPLGYMTAQIRKNHLGDRNEFLPTVLGFAAETRRAVEQAPLRTGSSAFA